MKDLYVVSYMAYGKTYVVAPHAFALRKDAEEEVRLLRLNDHTEVKITKVDVKGGRND